MRSPADNAAWREFEQKYGDLILRYCIHRGLKHQDAEDVRQMVLLNLARTLPRFKYQPERGRFRSYLGQTVRHAIALFFSRRCPSGRKDEILMEEPDQVADGSAFDAAEAEDLTWNKEWVRHHYRKAMHTLRATHEPRSIEIFNRLLAGASVRVVAASFEMSEQAVQKVKQRVRDRMRDLIAAQLRDEEDPREPEQ